jgi:hypothetical protein
MSNEDRSIWIVYNGEIYKGKVDHAQRIWSLINLELWHQMFIDSRQGLNAQ